MEIESIKRKKKFTNKSIEGTYGFSASGSLINFGNPPITGPIVVVGLINFDGNGGGSVKATANTVQPPGNFIFTSTSFTYQVNPDGTGTTTFTSPSMGAIHLSFVIVNNGKELLDIRTDTGAISGGIAKRQSDGSGREQFTNKSIEGTYGFSSSGSLINFGNPPITGPIVVVGLISFDGNGSCSSTRFAENLPPPVGTVPAATSAACIYQVNPDGTGTKKITFPTYVINLSFVIVNNGRELLEIHTDTGVIVSGIAKRQE